MRARFLYREDWLKDRSHVQNIFYSVYREIKWVEKCRTCWIFPIFPLITLEYHYIFDGLALVQKRRAQVINDISSTCLKLNMTVMPIMTGSDNRCQADINWGEEGQHATLHFPFDFDHTRQESWCGSSISSVIKLPPKDNLSSSTAGGGFLWLHLLQQIIAEQTATPFYLRRSTQVYKWQFLFFFLLDNKSFSYYMTTEVT